MKRSVVFTILLVLALAMQISLTGQAVWADGFYEDDTFRFSISKGWDTLSDDVYRFEGLQPFAVDTHFSRMLDRAAKEHNRTMSKQQLTEHFEEHFTPVILTVLQKQPLDRGKEADLAITHLYTCSNSFIVNELCGWEHEHNRITKSMGAYYFLDVPVHLNYEIVFLLPKKLAAGELRVNITGSSNFRCAISTGTDDHESLSDRITVLEHEIERLQNKLLELEDESSGGDPSVT